MKILINISESNDEEHQRTLEKTGFWGRRAAGCLIYAEDTGRILIGKRSMGVLEPNTWGTFGGAIDEGEKPAHACEREVQEETGYSGIIQAMIPLYVFKVPNFEYHNFLCVVKREFKPKLNWENSDTQWTEPPFDFPKPLHVGMKALLQHCTLSEVIRKYKNDSR